MEEKTNGNLTNIELEMAIDELKRRLPYLIQQTEVSSKVLKGRYDNLVGEGFTKEQALEIIKIRPLYE